MGFITESNVEYKRDTGYRGDTMDGTVAAASPIESKLNEAHNTLTKLEDNIDRLVKKLDSVINHNMDIPTDPSLNKLDSKPTSGSVVYISLVELVTNMDKLVNRINGITYKVDV